MQSFIFKNRIQFIRVPKAASRSILARLYAEFDPPEFGEPSVPMPSMAVCRHPYERVASSAGMFARVPYFNRLSTTVDDVLNAAEGNDPDDFFTWHCVPMTHPDIGLKPGTHMLHFERLDADWKSFAEQIGLPAQEPLPVKGRAPSTIPLTDAQKARARVIFADDFARFGYQPA